MLGPEGAGVFYLQHEHLNLLRPIGVGWHSVVQATDFRHVDFVLRDEAARYEGGSANMVGFWGLGASLALLSQQGLTADASPVAERVLEIANEAVERLSAIGAKLRFAREHEHASGIVTFTLPGRDPQRVRAECLDADVALSVRGGGLRISLHAYNDADDLDRLLDSLSSRRS